MFFNYSLRTLAFAFFLTLGLGGFVKAGTYTSVTDGDWSVPTTWDCGCVPTFTDNVIVLHNLNVAVTASVGNITLSNGITLTLESGSTLSLNGNLTGNISNTQYVDGPGNFNFFGTGTAFLSGNISFINTGGKIFSKNTLINSGTIIFRNSDLMINGSVSLFNINTTGVSLEAGTAIRGTSPVSSRWIQGTNSRLISRNPASFIGSNVTFDAESNFNTVEFTSVSLPTRQVIPGGKYQVVEMTEDNSELVLEGIMIILNELYWDSSDIVLDVSSSNWDILMQGNWMNNSTAVDPFNQRNGTVSFVGNSSQNLNSVPVDTFYNLTMNQANVSRVQVWNDIWIENTLTMSRGLLSPRFSGNKVVIEESGTIAGGSSNSFIIATGMDGSSGTFVRKLYNSPQNASFPIGTNSRYQPFTIDLNSATFSGTDYLDVRVSTTDTGHPNKPDGAYSNHYWFVDYAGFTAIDYDVAAGYVNQFTGNEGAMKLGRWSGVSWDFYDAADISADVLSSSDGISDLPADHQFAGVEQTPFPVLLTSFDAIKVGGAVNLDWNTATETNNDRFRIERSSDGFSFAALGEVEGQGNSSSLQSYRYTDTNPQAGMNYYRLVQIDFDGQETPSPVVTVSLDATAGSELVLRGNPVLHSNPIQANFISTDNTQIQLQLMNTSGAVLLNKSLSMDAGVNSLSLDELTGTLTPGIYLMQVSGPQVKMVKKVVVN